MQRSLILMSSVFLLCCCQFLSVKAQVYHQTTTLQEDIVTFPVTLIDVYPFIPASVNGVAGKFMFDTGIGMSFMLNDHFVDLPHKRAKSSGITGSGQAFKTNINDTIREIRFSNGPTYRNLKNIGSANYDFLQRYVTPDFLGFVGHQFFNGCLFKLDYLHRKITFYRNTEQRSNSKDFLNNEKLLAVIGFELRKLPNSPIIKIKIGGVDVLAAFDTGQSGLLQLDQHSEKILRNNGSIDFTGTDSSGDTLLTVKDIIMAGNLKTTLKGITLNKLADTRVIRREHAITEPNLMTIGYRFLAQYKTVWDYANKKIYILEY